ncbi:MAG TPA: hypothetical protein VFU71_23445 [Burkholderiaceae bacterium]|nr:hypothetical protein [Burkholderiaceae bacterium]
MTYALELMRIMAWGLIATALLTALSFAAQNFGWSRLNFPMLLGTFFTGERAAANVLGFVLYLLVGWLIAFLYYLLFALIGGGGWLAGLAAGLIHALLLLTVALPMLPYVHPRMASEFDGPDAVRRLEPPGFLALHYGNRTPAVLLLAYAAYGAVLGYGYGYGYG